LLDFNSVFAFILVLFCKSLAVLALVIVSVVSVRDELTLNDWLQFFVNTNEPSLLVEMPSFMLLIGLLENL
jgi:hypothetical protein